MKRTVLTALLLIAAVTLSPAARAQSGEPGRCPNDSKLLNGGPTLVDDYWGLVVGGLDAAGFGTDEQKVDYLSQVFGVDFQSLEEARDYNLEQLSATFDLNQNRYVCVFEQRGTRANFGELYSNLTFFGVSDDLVRKKQ